MLPDIEEDLKLWASVPAVHEMVLFVPDLEREALGRTVKHESFHAHLHGLVDEAPIWFHEGYAPWFENAAHRGEALLIGGIEADSFRTLRAGGTPSLAPVREPVLPAVEGAFRRRMLELFRANPER